MASSSSPSQIPSLLRGASRRWREHVATWTWHAMPTRTTRREKDAARARLDGHKRLQLNEIKLRHEVVEARRERRPGDGPAVDLRELDGHLGPAGLAHLSFVGQHAPACVRMRRVKGGVASTASREETLRRRIGTTTRLVTRATRTSRCPGPSAASRSSSIPRLAPRGPWRRCPRLFHPLCRCPRRPAP